MCDFRFLLGGAGWRTLYVFDVSAELTVRAAGSVLSDLPLASTRLDGNSLYAFSHWSSVSLQLLAAFPFHLSRSRVSTSLMVDIINNIRMNI